VRHNAVPGTGRKGLDVKVSHFFNLADGIGTSGGLFVPVDLQEVLPNAFLFRPPLGTAGPLPVAEPVTSPDALLLGCFTLTGLCKLAV